MSSENNQNPNEKPKEATKVKTVYSLNPFKRRWNAFKNKIKFRFYRYLTLGLVSYIVYLNLKFYINRKMEERALNNIKEEQEKSIPTSKH